MTGSCSTARLNVSAASCGRPRSSSDWPAPTNAGTCAGIALERALEGGVGTVEIVLEQEVAAEIDQVFGAPAPSAAAWWRSSSSRSRRASSSA